MHPAARTIRVGDESAVITVRFSHERIDAVKVCIVERCTVGDHVGLTRLTLKRGNQVFDCLPHELIVSRRRWRRFHAPALTAALMATLGTLLPAEPRVCIWIFWL